MNAIRLNAVLVLLVVSNVLNMIYPKGMGFEEQRGWEYELSKYTYGICMLLMLPSLISTKKYYFAYMQYMAFYIMFYMVQAIFWNYDFESGYYLKTLLICLSFVFFEDILSITAINKNLLYLFMFSVFINVAYLVLIQNRLEIAIENEGEIGGGQVIANSMVHILPLLFLLLNGKIASYLYMLGFVVVLVSLRRTAMLAYLLCVPFVFRQLSNSISKKFVIAATALLVFLVWYVVTNYWVVLEMRFSDTFEASNSGYYGSGRTGWWEVLLHKFYSSPQNWLQGFGLGQVSKVMAKAGFPFVHAHNDYIEVGYTYGLIGIFLWFGTFGRILKLSKKKNSGDNSAIVKMSVISYLFVAFFSSSVYNPHLLCVAIFAALIINRKTSLR